MTRTSRPCTSCGRPSCRASPTASISRPILPAALEQPERDAEALEATFVDRLRRDGLLGEWRVIHRDSHHQPAVHARYADLVIAGQVREYNRAAGAGGRGAATWLLSAPARRCGAARRRRAAR
jgi:hypothetical protein